MSGNSDINSDIKSKVKAGLTAHFANFFVRPTKEYDFRNSFAGIDGSGYILFSLSRNPAQCFMFDKNSLGELVGYEAIVPLDIDELAKADRKSLPGLVFTRAGLEKRWAQIPTREIVDFLGLDGEPDCGLAQMSFRNIQWHVGDDVALAHFSRDDIIRNDMARLAKAGLGEIGKGINPKILSLLRPEKELSWKIYNFYAQEDEVGEIRRQALGYYPLFARFFESRFSFRRFFTSQVEEKKKHEEFLSSKEYQQKLDSVEERNGVAKTLKEWMEQDNRPIYPTWLLSEKAVRGMIFESFKNDETGKNDIPQNVITGLRGVGWKIEHCSLERLMFTLAELPPDWLPKNKDDWSAFISITSAFGGIKTLTAVPGAQPASLRSLYDSCSGKWQSFALKIANAYMDRRPPEGATEEDFVAVSKAIQDAPFSELPPEKIPAAVSVLIEDIFDKLSGGVRRETWVGWVLTRVRPDVGFHAMKRIADEAFEVCDAFANKAILPAAAHFVYKHSPDTAIFIANKQLQAARETAAQLLFSGKSLLRVVETLRQYANHAAAIDAAGISERTKQEIKERGIRLERANQFAPLYAAVGLQRLAEPGPGQWAPLCPPYVAPNGIYAVPLTSEEELEEEGYSRPSPGLNKDGSYGLGICVGEKGMPYIRNCRTKGEHIVSFRLPTPGGASPYVRLGCLQIGALKEGERTLKSLQFRGPENKDPQPDAVLAKTLFFQAVARGEIPIFYDDIRKYQEINRKKVIDEVAAICGFAWTNPTNLNASIEPWGRFLPKKYRSMSLEQFVSSEAIAPVAETLAHGITSKAKKDERQNPEPPAPPRM